MSDHIDELFRDSMNQTPETTPPPGQWEKIRRREPVILPASRAIGWNRLLLGLFLGTLMAGPAGYYLGNNACGAQPQDAGEVVAAELVSKPVLPPVITAVTPAQEKLAEQGKTAISPSRKARISTVFSPASPAPEYLRRTGVRASKIPSQPSPQGRAIENAKRFKAPELMSTDLTIPLPTFITPVLSGPEISTTSNTDYTYLPKSLALKADVPLPDPMLLFARYELGQYGRSAGIVVPDLSTKVPNPKGRWEASLHFMPWVTRRTSSVQVLSSTDNGRTPREIDFDGQPVTLYPSGSIDPDQNRRLRVEMLSLEAGRQFPNGIRLGVGVYLEPSQYNYIRNETELFNSQLLESEWATYFASESERLSMSLTFGYTFRRRKRLRPYLGLFLGSRFYQEGRLVEVVFRRSDRRIDLRQVFSYRDSGNFGDLFLFAQAGLQYQISERLSVGLEVVPGLGVGGRYRF